MKSSDKRVQITSHLKFCSPTLLGRQHTDICIYLKRPQKFNYVYDILTFDSTVLEEESLIPVLTCQKKAALR